MLAGVREKVASLKGQGRPIDETIAAKPTLDSSFKAALGRVEGFVRLVYQGV